jgi:monoamine oxidase
MVVRGKQEMPENNDAGYITFVDNRRFALKREYDRSINRDLAKQNYQGLMKRNFTAVLAQLYKDALKLLEQQEFEIESDVDSQTLYDQYMKPFEGMIDELLQYVLQHHRSSCAMSNFPDEHNPTVTYIAEVLQLAEQDYAAFKQDVGKLLQPVSA